MVRVVVSSKYTELFNSPISSSSTFPGRLTAAVSVLTTCEPLHFRVCEHDVAVTGMEPVKGEHRVRAGPSYS